ncbi:MAG TPA: transposase [Bryobacteraceae bacterium]|nr:transposase [Bryobacteraceae bacterium]
MNSRRRLPHSYPEGRWLFITWTLHGVVPSWRFPPAAKTTSREAFAWVDAYLDTRRSGPMYLAEEPVAEIVIDSLYRGAELGHYELGPFVVMANHVHALFLPVISPAQFLKSLKGFTAREANRFLNRTGQPFWQRESYDHWVRSAEEWNRIARYIEKNPLKADLVRTIEDYPWSSAHPRFSVDTSVNAARRSACATSACTTSACAAATLAKILA